MFNKTSSDLYVFLCRSIEEEGGTRKNSRQYCVAV